MALDSEGRYNPPPPSCVFCGAPLPEVGWCSADCYGLDLRDNLPIAGMTRTQWVAYLDSEDGNLD